jgi:hypothetical protein
MTAEKKQFRLGLVGYGEIGSTIGRGLRGAGLEAISSYDKYAFDGPCAWARYGCFTTYPAQPSRFSRSCQSQRPRHGSHSSEVQDEGSPTL